MVMSETAASLDLSCVNAIRSLSIDAVQKAKRLFNARKVGHTGALDPLATGVLPLCFGEATKFSQYLLSSDKKYWVRIKLGIATDSGDSDGQVIRECPVEGVDAEKVEDALRFEQARHIRTVEAGDVSAGSAHVETD